MARRRALVGLVDVLVAAWQMRDLGDGSLQGAVSETPRMLPLVVLEPNTGCGGVGRQ